MTGFRLTRIERAIFQKLGEAVLPETSILPRFDAKAVEERFQRFFGAPGSVAEMALFLRAMIWVLEQSPFPRRLRPLSMLPEGKRLDHLEREWASAALPRRVPFRLFTLALRSAYIDNPAIYERLGVEYRKPPVVEEERPRWRERIVGGRTFERDTVLEAEVVVVGTGAGGAMVAHELARRGDAVLLVEQGDYFHRPDFTGRPFEMQRLMYERAGLTLAVGNVTIPVPLGRTVGGTTTINSGTCLRPPRRVLRRWREELALTDYTQAGLAPHIERVEALFQVRPADMKYAGKNGEIVARGAERLGYSHGPLPRNAPDCTGEGVCALGCPSGAKRSADVSLVPKALESQAQLLCRVRCEEILVAGGRATGIRARALDTGRTVTVKARVVVLAAGAFGTPLMLAKQKLCAGSGQLGRNLSIHPGAGVIALMDEDVDSHKSIPQGYMVDEFEEEGLLLEGAAFPLGNLALVVPQIGPKGQALVEAFRRLASFGAMVCDTSRGRVVRGAGGAPLALYRMNGEDQALLRRGIGILARIYLAAGAREVHANVHRWKPMRTEADIDGNLALASPARDMDISAFHPLGSCRMSGWRDRSVCAPNGETWEIRNLFVADGSLIPPALGVNPQVTIAAVAGRVADHVHDRLA